MFARRWWPCAGVLIGSLALPLESPGAVLTFTMEGDISQVIDPLGLLNFAGLGDHVTYTFSFDPTTPDANPTPTRGIYEAITAEIRANETSFSLASIRLPRIEIQHPGDLYTVSSYFNVSQPGLEIAGFFQFVLDDQTESDALANDLLPQTPPTLESFRSTDFVLEFWPANWGHNPPTLALIGTVGSLTPEPTCLTALVLGTMLFRRRGKHRPS